MLDVGALYADYAPDVTTFVRRLLPRADVATVEDRVSEVFEKVYRSRHLYHEQGRGPRGWLLTVTRRHIIDWLRHERIVTFDSFEWLNEGGRQWVDGRDDFAHLGLRDALSGALQQLTDSQRAVIEARFLAGQNIAETAALLGRSDDAVKQMQGRALASLRRRLEEAA